MKSAFARVKKSGLQGCSVGQFREILPGPGIKMFREKNTGSSGGRDFFSKQEIYAIYHISLSERYAIYHICCLVNCLTNLFPGFLEGPKCPTV